MNNTPVKNAKIQKSSLRPNTMIGGIAAAIRSSVIRRPRMGRRSSTETRRARTYRDATISRNTATVRATTTSVNGARKSPARDQAGLSPAVTSSSSPRKTTASSAPPARPSHTTGRHLTEGRRPFGNERNTIRKQNPMIGTGTTTTRRWTTSANGSDRVECTMPNRW